MVSAMPKVESQPPEGTPPASQQELSAYIRKNLIRTLVSLVLLFVVLAVLGKLYEQQLLAVTEGVYQKVGVGGLLAILFTTDAIFSPVPPDVVLVVIANSTLHQQWAWLLPVVGVVSAAAGSTGWVIGRRFAAFRWASPWISKVRRKHQDMLRRYDRWAVALGAITPLPFSLICITAGALGMPYKRMAPITLLRIPRFLIVYAVIAGSIAL